MDEEKTQAFVFYRGFYDVIKEAPLEDQRDMLFWLIECALGDITVDDIPLPWKLSIKMMMINVDQAKKRYEQSVEDGRKGGRPAKYIPPEEWIPYRKTHSRKETAEYFGINVKTLAKWEKSKNLTVTDTDTVTVTVTDTDTVTVTSINNNNKYINEPESNADADSVSLKEVRWPDYDWVGEPYEMEGLWYRDYTNERGERAVWLV